MSKTDAVRRTSRWATVWVCIALISVIVIAAGLDNLQLRPGRPFSLASSPAEAGTAPMPLSWLSERTLSTVMAVLFILGMISLPVAVVLAIVSPKFRKQLLIRLLPVVALVAWALLVVARREEPAQVEGDTGAALAPAQQSATPPVPEEVFDATPPKGLVWAIRLGLVALLAGAVGTVLWFVWRRRPPARNTLEQLAREAEGTVAALRGGADVRDAVLRCYFEMIRVLEEERGLVRGESMTPREFERRLSEAGLPEFHVEQLTRLFESARYSTRSSDEADAQEAISSLGAIVQASRSMA